MWFESAPVEVVRDTFPEWMAFVFVFLSYLGSVWFVAPVVVLAFWFGDRHRFASWIGVVMGGYAIMVALKSFFEIPRPDVGPAIAPESLPTVVALLYLPAVDLPTSSFPSGHAIAGTIVWTMIALEFDVGTRRQRFAAAATVVVLVAFSRVGAGVHYPIDVVVGVLVAIAYLVVILAVRDRLRTRSHHVATSTVFATSAALSLVAFLLGGGPDAMALFGGAVGALLAWQFATPAPEPWPTSRRGIVRALFGVAIVGLAAFVLLVAQFTIVWLLVGIAGGATVLGLPHLFSITRSSSPRSEVTG